MAIYAGGPGYQKSTIGSSIGTVYSLAGVTNPYNMTVVNTGSAVVYLGTNAVTAATGIPLASGGQLTIQGPAIALWGITASGTAYVEAGLSTVAAVD